MNPWINQFFSDFEIKLFMKFLGLNQHTFVSVSLPFFLFKHIRGQNQSAKSKPAVCAHISLNPRGHL